MRILHVVTAFPRGPDDPITPWLVELLQRLRAAGHEVEVLTSAYKGSPDQTFAGIPVHRFRYFLRRWENLTHEETAPDRMRRSLLYRVMPLFFVIGGMLAIRRLTRRRPYDIIHVHWPLPLALLGWAAQRRGRPPVVTTFYGAELRLGFRRFLTWAARRSRRVIAISSYTAGALREIVDVPVEIVPYAAAMPPAPPRESRPSGPATVLFVGRLVERKGVTHLVEALARLEDQQQARLVVVGDGPERPRLEARARELGVSDRVVFRGRVGDVELQRAYQEADVFVLPAVLDTRGDTEGLGVVLLEAMSYGVPVIGSNVGGIVDIVVDGETGVLVPPGDAGALARALQGVLANPARGHALGEAGRRRLVERFSWDAIVSRIEAVYRSVS